MAFVPVWTNEADAQFRALQAAAAASLQRRRRDKKAKATKAEGLFSQVCKSVELLLSNPKHPSLNTHEYDSIEHPYDRRQKVFEAYAQSKTPRAYRVFWCYGRGSGEITIIAITSHP